MAWVKGCYLGTGVRPLLAPRGAKAPGMEVHE